LSFNRKEEEEPIFSLKLKALDSSEGEYLNYCIIQKVYTELAVILAQPFDSETILLICVVTLLILGSALVSGSEVAYFSITPEQLGKLKNNTPKTVGNARILSLIKTPQYLLATILIANNLFNIAIIVFSYFITNRLLSFEEGSWLGFVVNGVAVTFILVLFGEIIPKVYATQFNLRLARFTSLPLSLMRKLFYPISYLLVNSTSFIEQRLTKEKGIMDSQELKEVRQAIDELAGSNMSEQDRKLIKGLVDFGNITARQIMKARVDIVSIEKSDTFEDLKKTVINSGFSRIPVYKETIDKITGILYAKDLLPFLDKADNFNWHKLPRRALFIPENKKISDLFKELQEKHIHMAIVVDEYGGTQGLITLEDVLEVVVGEIRDEFDKAAQEIQYVVHNDHSYTFPGKTMLHDICTVMNIDNGFFEEAKGETDSLAGLLLELKERFPEIGDEMEYKNITFTVLSNGTANHIGQVKITVEENDATEATIA